MKTNVSVFPQCQYLPSGDRLMSEEDRCQVGYLIFCATGWVPPPASSPWTNQLAVVGIIVTMHDWAQITTWALLLLGREQPGTSSLKPLMRCAIIRNQSSIRICLSINGLQCVFDRLHQLLSTLRYLQALLFLSCG